MVGARPWAHPGPAAAVPARPLSHASGPTRTRGGPSRRAPPPTPSLPPFRGLLPPLLPPSCSLRHHGSGGRGVSPSPPTPRHPLHCHAPPPPPQGVAPTDGGGAERFGSPTRDAQHVALVTGDSVAPARGRGCGWGPRREGLGRFVERRLQWGGRRTPGGHWAAGDCKWR